MHSTEPVRRLMTEAVLSIDVSESAGEVLRQFAAYPVHHMPVVDGGRVVGMISSADLMKLDAFLPRKGLSAIEFLNSHVKLEALMQRPAVTVGGNESVARAAELMATKGIHALPVVDDRGMLIGIVTTTDIMGAALRGDAAGGQGSGSPDPAALTRMRALEAVLLAAERYIGAGQDERLHAELVRAIERARASDATPAPGAGRAALPL
jgi:CBS domain-containing protein